MGKVDTFDLMMINTMKYRYVHSVIKGLMSKLNTYNPIYYKMITKITDYILDILWPEYDLKTIVYPPHGTHYILRSISGDIPQLTRHPPQ